MSVYHCENDKAITQPFKAQYLEALCLIQDFLQGLKIFLKYLDFFFFFPVELCSCIYCFLSQDGSMSKTLRKYSSEFFLTF